LHLIWRGRFDKGETLGLLRFVVADHFNGIRYEVFRGQPLFNVIGRDPRREITKKYGKAHSVAYLLRWLDWWHFKGGIRLPPQIVPRRKAVCK